MSRKFNDVIKAMQSMQSNIEKKVDEYRENIAEEEALALAKVILTSNFKDTSKKSKKSVSRFEVKRRKKVMSGFTSASSLIPIVKKCLEDNGSSMRKKEICEKIIGMNILTSSDFYTHSDGKMRIYKTLDSARRIMIDSGMLVSNQQGVWELVPAGHLF
jgi:hypothetical protein